MKSSMTLEKAIEILDPETSAMALADYGRKEGIEKVDEACVIAVRCMRAVLEDSHYHSK